MWAEDIRNSYHGNSHTKKIQKNISVGQSSDTNPVYLDVVQLLLPLQDVLHAVHPHVDVSHQDRLAHVLNQTTQ